MLPKILNEWLFNLQLYPRVWILERLQVFRVSLSVSGSRLKAVFRYLCLVANALSCRISNWANRRVTITSGHSQNDSSTVRLRCGMCLSHDRTLSCTALCTVQCAVCIRLRITSPVEWKPLEASFGHSMKAKCSSTMVKHFKSQDRTEQDTADLTRNIPAWDAKCVKEFSQRGPNFLNLSYVQQIFPGREKKILGGAKIRLDLAQVQNTTVATTLPPTNYDAGQTPADAINNCLWVRP